jgi:hypothetical protein
MALTFFPTILLKASLFASIFFKAVLLFENNYPSLEEYEP